VSVRPSVCPVDRQQQRRLAGLLLKSSAGSRYRLIAAAAVRNAGRVNFDPSVRRSIIFVTSNPQQYKNKAVIDRRLRPRCCYLGSYVKRPECSPVRPLACNWYYCAQFIAKPKAACALRFSWAATSSDWLISKYDVIHKTGNT